MKPVLDDVEEYYYSTFHFLSLGRSTGMGLGAISLGDIISFHSIFGAPHSLPIFAKILRSVDSEFLKEQRKD